MSECWTTRGVKDGFVVSLNGRIGGPEADSLQSELTRLEGLQPKVMILDMGGVSMLSSAALSVLVRTSKKGASSHVRLASVPEPTMKLLQSVKLDTIAPIFATVDAAMK